jgi:hypothetical protein
MSGEALPIIFSEILKNLKLCETLNGTSIENKKLLLY